MVVEPEMERAGGVWGECLCRVVITALGEWIENRRFLKTVHQHPCSARPEGRVELHGWNMEAVGKHFFSRGSVALFFPDCQSILEESESLRFIRKWIFFFFFFDGAFFFSSSLILRMPGCVRLCFWISHQAAANQCLQILLRQLWRQWFPLISVCRAEREWQVIFKTPPSTPSCCRPWAACSRSVSRQLSSEMAVHLFFFQ